MTFIKYFASACLAAPALWLLIAGPRNHVIVPQGAVVVDYWEKWTGAEETQMKQIVDDFNDTVGKQQHIFVRFVSTSDIEQKTLVATAAGIPPDIAGLYDGNLVTFASLNALTPLEELAANSDPPITSALYKKAYWDGCNYKGHLYALISTPATIALLYNKIVFQQNAVALRRAGLDPDRPPRTLEELDAYARVMEHRNAKNQLVSSGYLPTVPGWYINETYFWFGGHIWDPVHEKFTLTDPAVVKAFEWVQSYSRRLGSEAINDFKSGIGTFDSPQNEFMTGTVAMEQQGPWMANYIVNNKPSMDGLKPGEADDTSLPLAVRRARMQWAVAPFPSAVAGMDNITYCAFDSLVIPRGAKHPKEAFKFMAFVNRQDEMEKLCNMHSKNSPLKNSSKQFLEHSKNAYIDVFDALADSPNARSLPQVPILAEVNDELANAIDRIALLKAEPRVALQEAQDRLQQDYDLFASRQRARLGR
jgi:ABC-type glycerol-3-phosphate transport system substrate-binding protein